MVELHLPGHPGQLRRAWRIELLGDGIEELENPLGPGQGALHLVIEVAELAQRFGEAPRVGDEGGDGADRHQPLDRQAAPQAAEDGDVQVGEDAHHRHHQQRQGHGLNPDRAHRLVGGVETAQYLLLLAEGEHHPLAAVGLLENGVERPEPRLVAAKSGAGSAPHGPDQAEHQRKGEHRAEGEPGAEDEDDAEDARQGQNAGEELRGVVGKDPADGVHVVGQPAHQLPLAALVEKAQREALQVAKEIPAQIAHRLLGKAGEEPPLEQLRRRRKGVGAEHQQGHVQEDREVPSDQLVDGLAHEVGPGQGQGGAEGGDQRHQGDDPALGIEVGRQAAQRPPRILRPLGAVPAGPPPARAGQAAQRRRRRPLSRRLSHALSPLQRLAPPTGSGRSPGRRRSPPATGDGCRWR